MRCSKKFLCAILTVTSITTMSVTNNVVSAFDNMIYGTMEIPYAEFFENEGVSTEVDAVSSATTNKWKNENLTAGTFNKENEDGTGTILGVKYNVALTKETLYALGENNYNFTELTNTPKAYKIVTIKDNSVVDFSPIIGDTTPIENASATISSSTAWGDYVIDIKSINNSNGTSDIGTIYGALLTTENNDVYAMRHLQNIWRDELAWSSGFKTTEPHGNALDYEDYVLLMGQTINKITYITDTGYHTINTSLYVPIKFENEINVESADINSNSTSYTVKGLPEDYSSKLEIAGLDATINANNISFKNAKPNSYSLTVSDKNGKYDSISTSFMLYTNTIPVQATNTAIVPKEGISSEDFENYVKNVSSVKVDDVVYSSSGKGAVKIINEDGSINFNAKSKDLNIFDQTKNSFTLTISATGYTNDYTFVVTKNEQEVTSTIPTQNTTESTEPTNTEPTEPTNPTSATNTEPTATISNSQTFATTTTNNTKTNNSNSKDISAVATGATSTLIYYLISFMVAAIIVALCSKKKN